jgi:hypothetical protein
MREFLVRDRAPTSPVWQSAKQRLGSGTYEVPANSIAYLSELIEPKSIFLELTRQNLMKQSMRYLIWGEGEIGLLVYSILVHYWAWARSPQQSLPTLVATALRTSITKLSSSRRTKSLSGATNSLRLSSRRT